jgi:hypothetical protein
LTEWRLDPVYIAENWTDELLGLMIEKLNTRHKAISEAMSGRTGIGRTTDTVVTDKQLFEQLGNKIKVVR